MEVKVTNLPPLQVSAAPSSPNSDFNNPKQDSRSMRIIQYLTRTVSGNGLKDSNPHTLQMESRPDDASDSAESDEDSHTHAHSNRNPSDSAQPGFLRKLSHKLVKTDTSHAEEEKGHASEGAYGWGMSKGVIEVSKGVAADLKGSFGRLLEMKSMLIEKLASVPTVPAETLEHARHSIESIIVDATHSAYGKTRDAMARIRVKLVEIIPSLSPYETKMIVDDVEREVLDKSKSTTGDDEKTKEQGKDGRVGVSTSTASAVMTDQPLSGLAAANVDHSKAWALLRSRM